MNPERKKPAKTFYDVRPELLDEWDKDKNGDLDPCYVSHGSRAKVWWVCSQNSEHKWEANVNNRVRFGYGCPFCSGLKVDRENSIASLYPELMKEWDWDKNQGIDPYTVSRGSQKKVSWICSNNDKHRWEAYVMARTTNERGCPFCSGHRVDAGNCLQTLRPDLALEWHPSKNGSLTARDVTNASGKKIWWKCGTCLNEWRTDVRNRTLNGSICPSCAKDKALETRRIRETEEDASLEANYDFEDEIQLNSQEYRKIFSDNIKIESEVIDIHTLLGPRKLDKINYDPYYQRKYVWDKDKATYFVESVLIGTEIPPLIFFVYEGISEVIDGRQRFETIKRFYENQRSLTKKGLRLLTDLEKLTFDGLPPQFRERFFDTQVRVINFTSINEIDFSERQKDLLKKEIFKRYNSGITPLRRMEIDKAIYINDEPTGFFKRKLKGSRPLYECLVQLFLRESDHSRIEDPNTLEKLIQIIRFLLIAADLPIKALRRAEIREPYYEKFSESIENIHDIFKRFTSRVKVVAEICEEFGRNDFKAGAYWNETFYWAVSVLEKEGVDIASLLEADRRAQILGFAKDNAESFSQSESGFLYAEYIRRYDLMRLFLESVYGLSLSSYVESSRGSWRSLLQRKDAESDDLSDELYIGIRKQEPVTYTVEGLCHKLDRGKFLIRPPYQRGEVINKTKSSKIIESILLGMKLPPIYIYRHADGLHEVIDGQQRLLSILGFLGKHFFDESGVRCYSNKNEFTLTKLEILSDLNRVGFADLDPVLKDRIWDHSIPFIVIDERINPDFEPIDLFVRLNSRPYPIKENTFEMWNSCVSKEIIDAIRLVAEKHSVWFYQTKSNIRMKNEELISILVYFEYENRFGKSEKEHFLQITQRSSNVFVRIKQKRLVTNLLYAATRDEGLRANVLQAVKRVDSFVSRISTILLDKDVPSAGEYLDGVLTELFNAEGRKYYVRKNQDFYTLWFISEFLSQGTVDTKRREIRSELFELFKIMKSFDFGEENVAVAEFKDLVSGFYDKYVTESRSLRLSVVQRKEILAKQGNRCAICEGELFFADKPHFDHAISLSQGGSDSLENMQAVHKICNLRKGAHSVR